MSYAYILNCCGRAKAVDTRGTCPPTFWGRKVENSKKMHEFSQTYSAQAENSELEHSKST